MTHSIIARVRKRQTADLKHVSTSRPWRTGTHSVLSLLISQGNWQSKFVPSGVGGIALAACGVQSLS